MAGSVAACSSIPVERLPIRLEANEDWVITLPFFHGGQTRVRSVFRRIEQLSEEEVESLLETVLTRFSHRHNDFGAVLDEHYDMAAALVESPPPIGSKRRRLIGSYFTMEYAIASAALFNPSIVPHPNQNNVPAGGLRFLMSLRATGEGHLSSIVFRTGLIHADRSVEFYPVGPFLQIGRAHV